MLYCLSHQGSMALNHIKSSGEWVEPWSVSSCFFFLNLALLWLQTGPQSERITGLGNHPNPNFSTSFGRALLNQSRIFIGRTDIEAETPILWPPYAKNWLIGEKTWCWERLKEEKGTTGDEMVRWHHRLNGHVFERAPGVGDGKGSLACYSLGVAKSWTWLSDWTDWLNWELFWFRQTDTSGENNLL